MVVVIVYHEVYIEYVFIIISFNQYQGNISSWLTGNAVVYSMQIYCMYICYERIKDNDEIFLGKYILVHELKTVFHYQ